ncbi:MAG: phospholipase/lecithinase/hemolysin [Planctomycetota bacterium]|jgi:phospholipase/lecithinase/hemolysin
MLIRRLALLLAPLVLAVSLGAQGTTGLVAFGDSLSDNGRLFHVFGIPSAPYWNGRFSNGPVWVERVGPQLGIPSSNILDLAVGGSTTSNVLNLQVVPYISQLGTVPEGTVVTLWAGANDLLGLIDDPTQDPTAIIGEAITNLSDSIILLLGAGAEDVVIVNLPDLSLTPRVNGLGDPTATLAARLLSEAFNAALLSATLEIESIFNVDLVEIDAFSILTDVVADPEGFGFVNATDAALQGSTVDPKEAGFVFWDDIHPTTRAHREFARSVIRELRRREDLRAGYEPMPQVPQYLLRRP